MKFKTKEIIISGLILLLILRRKTKKVDINKFNTELINFIHKMEGGLSNDLTDTASKYPSPTPQKWHTNKGITWKVFIDNAKELNYAPTVSNFLTMPQSIWYSIYKNKYLNKANLTDNPVLNAYISLWYWGGWNKKLLPTIEVSNVLSGILPNKQKLKLLTELRIKYFNNIVKANPSQAKFLKGWTNRANEFYKQFEKYL